MPIFKVDLRAATPKCDIDHPVVPGRRRDRAQCPKCLRWDRHVQAVRRDQVRTGVRQLTSRAGAQRPITRARKCRGHVKYAAGCQGCQAWARYQSALRRQEIRDGVMEYSVPVAIARDHCLSLIDRETGGWRIREIAAVSGITFEAVSDIVNNERVGKVFSSTWNALRVLRPKGRSGPRVTSQIDATEVRRTMQGLAAQGWTFEHMAVLMGRATKTAANRLATDKTLWVEQFTIDMVRMLRDKLGEYDVNELDAPLPGMHRRCAAHAARRGWVPLRDWDGVDIADPDAKPIVACLPPPEADLVDAALRTTVLMAAERPEYIEALPSMNKLEAYAVVDYAQRAGLSATETGTLLGYSYDDEKVRRSGQRQATRLRSLMATARLWLETEPDGDTPTWLTEPDRCANPDFHKYLPALLAVQAEPFGYGLTVDQLTERCGADATTEQVGVFLARAAMLAARPWTPQLGRSVRKKPARRRTARTAPARGENRHAA